MNIKNPVIPNIAKTIKTLPPPEKVAIPMLKKTCADDCEGPLYSPNCEYTCAPAPVPHQRSNNLSGPDPHHRSTACAASTGTVGRTKPNQGKVNRRRYQERIFFSPLHCVAKLFFLGTAMHIFSFII